MAVSFREKIVGWDALPKWRAQLRKAGRKLADETFKLANSDACPTIKSLIQAAAAEWKAYAI